MKESSIRIEYGIEKVFLNPKTDVLLVKAKGGKKERAIRVWTINRNTPVGEDADLYYWSVNSASWLPLDRSFIVAILRRTKGDSK